METEILSDEELAELTGYKARAYQRRWLIDRQWVFVESRGKRPLVGRMYARMKLGDDQPHYRRSQPATGRVGMDARLFASELICAPRKTEHHHLPPRMYKRSRKRKNGATWTTYYYRDLLGKDIPVGKDLDKTRLKWAEPEAKEKPLDLRTMKGIFDRYIRDVVPKKAPRTQTTWQRSSS